jgi:hypothetical protein
MRIIVLIIAIVGCTLQSSTPTGDSGDRIQLCCNLLVPSEIRACFQERVDELAPPGECQWLTCDRGALRFVACAGDGGV